MRRSWWVRLLLPLAVVAVASAFLVVVVSAYLQARSCLEPGVSGWSSTAPEGSSARAVGSSCRVTSPDGSVTDLPLVDSATWWLAASLAVMMVALAGCWVVAVRRGPTWRARQARWRHDG